MPIFADNAHQLASAGFAILPADGKKPLIAGFPKWSRAPGSETLQGWAEKHPDANIAYVPGLCRVNGAGDSLIVIDADDAEAVEQISDVFGPTPGMSASLRGMHHLFRNADRSPLSRISSLRPFGINADLKHGRSIVLAPPSRHPDDRNFVYSWHGCDPMVIRELPPFNRSALERLISSAKSPGGKIQPNVTNTARPPLGVLRDGSRGLGLNDHLVSHVWACDSFDDLLDCACTFNMQLVEEMGYAALPEKEILTRTAAVWRDYEGRKIERWCSLPGVARTRADEIRRVCDGRKNGGDAFAFLMLLRTKHQARSMRGETFALDAKAMSKSKTLDWRTERFRNAIKLLIEVGYLERVTPHKNTRTGRIPAQYRLKHPSSC